MSDHEQNKKTSTPSPEPSVNWVTNWCERVKKRWESILWFFSVLLAIVGGFYYLLGPRVDAAAKRVILSPEVLEEFSSKLRPYAVIDAQINHSSATFDYDDHGTFSDVVDSVDFRQGDAKYIGILTFKMKKFVRLPLVRPLTGHVYVHSFWRTNKFDWAYEIRTSPTTESVVGTVTSGLSDDLSDVKDYKFFVELLTK